jgi:hypothetical protein
MASSRSRTTSTLPESRVALFPQQVRGPSDAPADTRADHGGMPPEQPIVDLANRHSEDLDVVLLWSRLTGRVWVTVTHRRSGRTSRIDATPANALDVFEHPFAYAQVAA